MQAQFYLIFLQHCRKYFFKVCPVLAIEFNVGPPYYVWVAIPTQGESSLKHGKERRLKNQLWLRTIYKIYFGITRKQVLHICN